ncbi:antibiotic biosynthesis monooxygenase [uncultured Sphingomonas sp.]|uniref:antibiotic biosynthesis monooxygenase family protein n=1 Tax=uncultured Sphingomonas sp. TaxID=158754 RepID=UPI0025DB589A|nr:antibiotic biosynthesis monooxygenase [uncultured Sphingomonas sp.]
MAETKRGQVAVIFLGRRTVGEAEEYAAAVAAMDRLAAEQPGYLGVHSIRGEDGFGITVSYWRNMASALAWRDHPVHAAIREKGRARWYESHEVIVTSIERSYAWEKGIQPKKRAGPEGPAHESLGEDA